VRIFHPCRPLSACKCPLPSPGLAAVDHPLSPSFQECENILSMSRIPLVLLSLCLLLTSGCDYHALNSAVHLPRDVQTLAVPTFLNHTNSFHTDTGFTQAVIRELTSRTPYQIINHADPDADATLTGEITSFSVVPLTYDNTTGRSSSFLVTIGAKLTVTDRNHKVLYQNSSYLFREQYEETQNLASFIQEDSAAERRLARDFASAAVSDILESF
jgi:outer membrane lipopolysaccharide assembly protein LptE/RlpB